MYHLATHTLSRMAIAAFLALFILGGVQITLAHAEDEATSTATTTKPRPGKLPGLDKAKENLQKDRNVRNEIINNKSTSSKPQGAENRILKAENKAELRNAYASRLIDRLGRHVAIMNNIVVRLESRIEKLEARNINVDEGKKLVGDAKIKIDAAEANIAALKTTLNAGISSTTATTTVKNPVKEVRALAGETVKKLKEAHKALVDAIKAINAKIKTEKPGNNNATSTNATSTNATSTNATTTNQ
jgi:hypothetical protein